MKPNYLIEMDHLALGLTKSPMFMGVNLKVFFGNMVLCTLICIHFTMATGVMFFVIWHVIAARMSVQEPNFLYLYWQSFIKTPPLLNYRYWHKTNSYQPW